MRQGLADDRRKHYDGVVGRILVKWLTVGRLLEAKFTEFVAVYCEVRFRPLLVAKSCELKLLDLLGLIFNSV